MQQQIGLKSLVLKPDHSVAQSILGLNQKPLDKGDYFLRLSTNNANPISIINLTLSIFGIVPEGEKFVLLNHDMSEVEYYQELPIIGQLSKYQFTLNVNTEALALVYVYTDSVISNTIGFRGGHKR